MTPLIFVTNITPLKITLHIGVKLAFLGYFAYVETAETYLLRWVKFSWI